MKITNIQVSPYTKGNNIKAFCSFSLDDQFAIRGVRIMEGKSGLYVAFPSRKNGNGEYEDLAFPTNKETYALMTEAIVNRYNQVINERTAGVDLSAAAAKVEEEQVVVQSKGR